MTSCAAVSSLHDVKSCIMTSPLAEGVGRTQVGAVDREEFVPRHGVSAEVQSVQTNYSLPQALLALEVSRLFPHHDLHKNQSKD